MFESTKVSFWGSFYENSDYVRIIVLSPHIPFLKQSQDLWKKDGTPKKKYLQRGDTIALVIPTTRAGLEREYPDAELSEEAVGAVLAAFSYVAQALRALSTLETGDGTTYLWINIWTEAERVLKRQSWGNSRDILLFGLELAGLSEGAGDPVPL